MWLEKLYMLAFIVEKVKHRSSPRICFKTSSKFGHYLRFPLFCFLKEKLYLCFIIRTCKLNVLKAANIKKVILKNLQKFIEKHLSLSVFLNKIAGPKPAT